MVSRVPKPGLLPNDMTGVSTRDFCVVATPWFSVTVGHMMALAAAFPSL